jgi:hypothetical protein
MVESNYQRYMLQINIAGMLETEMEHGMDLGGNVVMPRCITIGLLSLHYGVYGLYNKGRETRWLMHAGLEHIIAF